MSEVTPQSQHFLAPWAEEADIPAGRLTNTQDVPLGFAIGAATEVLYILSGRKYRSGRSLIRPTAINSAYANQSYLYPYSSMSGYGSSWGFAGGWSWTAMGMGWWQNGQDLSEVVLQGPVRKINEILVDGQPLQPSDYTLYDGRRLVRNVDASGTTTAAWPWNQKLALPLTEPGTWCVDEETEILTSEGWRRYDELILGESVYTFDPESQTARFEPLLAVNIFPAEPRKMRALSTSNHSSLTTLDHCWPVFQTSNGKTGFAWRRSGDLTGESSMIRCAPRADNPIDTKWSDAFVELVAWMWNEGCIEKTAKNDRSCRVIICQSQRANPQHVASIRHALSVVFPGGWTETTNEHEVVRFRLRVEESVALAAVVDRSSKAPLPSFIRSLTGSQLLLMIERCLDGDGSRAYQGSTTRNEVRVWQQKNETGVRTFEMICALAGIATNTRSQSPSDIGTGDLSLVCLLRRNTAGPVAAVEVSRRSPKPLKERRSIPTDEIVDYDGLVWCPSTPSRTWLARRNGTVYFTGNSIDYEWGNVAPDMGRMACVELTIELARSLSGDDYARLPARVLSVATQGVSVAVGDPLAYLAEGLIGLPVCDLFLKTYNKGGLRRRAIFLGPNSQLGREMATFPPTTPGGP